MANQSNNLKETVITIISEWGKEFTGNSTTVDKDDKVLSLISCNIKLSSDNRNFDLKEMRIDKSTVFNYKMKYSTTGNISKNDISELNTIFQKHKKIAKLLTSN